MKIHIFRLIIFFIIITLIYSGFGILGIIDFKKNQVNLMSYEMLNFHKKYSEKLHHLRDAGRWGQDVNDYLFSIINSKYSEPDYKILPLVQGDSWVEQLLQHDLSEKLIKNSMKKIIVAGITSYSPSPMFLQFKILKEEFNLRPTNLIIYIDQTDLGDEMCRYKKRRVLDENGNLQYLAREKYTNAIYDYTKIYMLSDLNHKKNFKFIKLANYKLKYLFFRTINRILELKKLGWKNRSASKCSFNEISKYLKNYDQNAKFYFIKILKEYLNYLDKQDYIKKVQIVTFPHLKHLTEEYKVNVSDYVDLALINFDKNKFTHFNFLLNDFDKDKINEIYIKGDLASHLNNIYHSQIFATKILEFVSEN